MLNCLLLPDWLLKPEYVTLATWGLVFATALLAGVTARQGRVQRKRWEKEDKDRKHEREELHERWQREDGQARIRERDKLLNDLIEQFNSPQLLIARAELARQLIGQPQSSKTGIEQGPALKFRLPNEVPPQAWTIASFFERLAQRWREDSLNTDAIDLRLGDYLIVFANEFPGFLKNEAISNKYTAWKALHQELQARREHDSDVAGIGALAAGYDKARAKFWDSEYKLFRLFPSDLPLPADEGRK